MKKHFLITSAVAPPSPTAASATTDLSVSSSSSSAGASSSMQTAEEPEFWDPRELRDPAEAELERRTISEARETLGDGVYSRLVGLELNPEEVWQLAKAPSTSGALCRLLTLGVAPATDSVVRAVCTYPHEFMVSPRASLLFVTVLGDRCLWRFHPEKLASAVTFDADGLLRVATHEIGSTSLMELVTTLQAERKHDALWEIAGILASGLDRVLESECGRGVVEHCLRVAEPECNEELYAVASSSGVKLAMHKKGCLLLAAAFIGDGRNPFYLPFLFELIDASPYLSRHPFGNYVVQCLVDLGSLAVNQRLSYALGGHYVDLAMDRHGSHVVEKLLRSSEMELVLTAILSDPTGILPQIAKDQFGNYVVQTALDVAQPGMLRDMMLHILTECKYELKLHPNGAKVFKAINLASLPPRKRRLLQQKKNKKK